MLPVFQRRLLPGKIQNRAFVFWDTETTGIDVKYEKIVQMGAVASNGTRFLRHRRALGNDSLCGPGALSEIEALRPRQGAWTKSWTSKPSHA